MTYQSVDGIQARALARSAIASLERHALFVPRVDDQIGYVVIAMDRQHRLRSIGTWGCVFVRDALVKQKDLDILRAVREKLDVDLRVTACCAVEHRTRQVGVESLQDSHQLSGLAPQVGNPYFMLAILKKPLVGSQLGFHFGVFR